MKLRAISLEDGQVLEKKYDGSWCQRILITLEDGRKGVFLGKVLVDEADHGTVNIENVDFFEPEQLPEGWLLPDIDK